MTKRQARLTLRFLKNGKISILFRNRVVCQCSDFQGVEAYKRGWYGTEA
jgi:hypothetical protein